MRARVAGSTAQTVPLSRTRTREPATATPRGYSPTGMRVVTAPARGIGDQQLPAAVLQLHPRHVERAGGGAVAVGALPTSMRRVTATVAMSMTATVESVAT